MAADTKIEWADHTFNPWVGCTKISPACDHCYAETWAKRTGSPGLWAGERRRTSEANWREPLKWNRRAAAAGQRVRVFPSLCDPFDNQVTVEWRRDFYALVEQTPHIDWLLLTKRPQNAASMLPPRPWPNIMIGATVENQPEAERRRPHLASIAAAGWRTFVSYEPALGLVDWRGWEFISWLISGGESGPYARPSHPDWHRSARVFCAANGIAYLFKQWGEWMDGSDFRSDAHVVLNNGEHYDRSHSMNDIDRHADGCMRFNPTMMARVGKARAGRLLDGKEHNAFPEKRHD